MTKRDFDTIARAVQVAGSTKRAVVIRLGRAFGQIMPFFDQEAFVATMMGEELKR